MEELSELIEKARNLKMELNVKSGVLNGLKEQIRDFMVDSGMEECNGVKIKRAFSSFDLELLRLEHEDLFERYAIREEHTITTYDNKISKKNLNLLQKEHPELWNDSDYRKELTARLYGL